jgi:PST family polysaccharide transporter
MELKRLAISGIRWSALSNFWQQAVQWGTTVVLVRLLSPSDFGLFTMASVVILFISIIKDLGTSDALVQKDELSEELLSSIFWLNAALGFISTGLLFLLSPAFSVFYKKPELAHVLQALSFIFIISGFTVPHHSILRRKLQFRKLTAIEATTALLSSSVAIGMALLGAGVWSLVFHLLTGSIVSAVMLWFMVEWRPKFVFRWAEVRSVSSYSLNLTGYNLANYLTRNADYILIGRFLGDQALGYYTLAYQLMLYPIRNISAIAGKVMFPVYSHIKDDIATFRDVYVKVAGLIAVVTLPAMLGLIVVSDSFVLALFGEKWAPVIPIFMILAIAGISQPIEATVSSIYQAKGRTDWFFRLECLQALVFTLSYVIGLRWGIIGVAVSYVIASTLLAYPALAIPFSLIELRVANLLSALWRPFTAGLLMMALVFTLKSLLPAGLSNALTLAALVAAGCIAYLAVSLVINRDQMRQSLEVLKTG